MRKGFMRGGFAGGDFLVQLVPSYSQVSRVPPSAGAQNDTGLLRFASYANDPHAGGALAVVRLVQRTPSHSQVDSGFLLSSQVTTLPRPESNAAPADLIGLVKTSVQLVPSQVHVPGAPNTTTLLWVG